VLLEPKYEPSAKASVPSLIRYVGGTVGGDDDERAGAVTGLIGRSVELA
jgi:hypothetical protein